MTLVMVEVKVKRLGVDRDTNSPVVILQETTGDRVLPIWIGTNEASAIAMELAGMKFARPLTHDLLRQVIVGLGAKLNQVRITSVQDNTYYAELDLRREDHVFQVDARPSDSIAVALRFRAPIYTNEGLLKRTLIEKVELESDDERLDRDDLKNHLQDMDPEDFGKFTP